MSTFTYSAPGGTCYLTIAATHPDKARRFNVRCSSGFQIGADGLRELARAIIAYAETQEPEAKPAPEPELPLPPPAPRKARRAAAADNEGQDGEA